jgi:hypothetical protein
MNNLIQIAENQQTSELDFLVGKINGNTGDCNTGSCNTGNYNIGNYNTGHYNTGDYNTGGCNAGHYNTGYYNTGEYNTGDYNTGGCNAGHYNTGYYNICDYSSGIFCTQEPKLIIFDIETDMTMKDFQFSVYYTALFSAPFELTKWVEYTDEEKQKDEENQKIGGYLKRYTYEEACKNWWKKMTDENKEIIKSMPNFDSKKFEQITGIKV